MQTPKMCAEGSLHGPRRLTEDLHCKPGPDLNSHLTQGGRKRLNSVKYASPGAHLSQEKQRNRKVRMSLMWSIFDSAVPNSTLWSQKRVEVGTGLTVCLQVTQVVSSFLQPFYAAFEHQFVPAVAPFQFTYNQLEIRLRITVAFSKPG
jgi:hypothetical protein